MRQDRKLAGRFRQRGQGTLASHDDGWPRDECQYGVVRVLSTPKILASSCWPCSGLAPRGPTRRQGVVRTHRLDLARVGGDRAELDLCNFGTSAKVLGGRLDRHTPPLETRSCRTANCRGGIPLPERDIFGAFAREHSKYIYFLLAAAAAATGYALDQIREDRTLALPDVFVGLAVTLWLLSFRTGCQRLISMLAGLHMVGRMDSPEIAVAIEAAGSSAKCQLRLFMFGAVSYAAWVVADLIP